jgi:hypothetical protein
VTLPCDADVVTTSADRDGVCLVRLEKRGRRLIITVLTSPDIRYRRQGRRSFTDLEEALAYVRAFAVAFRAGPPATRTDPDDAPAPGNLER